MTLPLSVTTPLRHTGWPPIFTSWRATWERAIGITSTGRGNLPSTSTSLLSSMMQTNFAEAAATIFSRVSAAPPPLISTPSAVASSAPSMYRLSGPSALRSSSGTPMARKLSEVRRELETAPESWILRSFSASMSSVTVEPVPMPSTMPLSMYVRAASAARRFFFMGVPISSEQRSEISYPPKQLCPLTRAQLITFEGLLFLSGLFLCYLLLRLLCFRCHDRNLRYRVSPGSEYIHD